MATISDSPRTPRPSSRVPSVTAPSWREATDSTRTFVTFRDGNVCWLCGTDASELMEVAHQISACETKLFVEMRNNGSVFQSLTHLAHNRNLILLCAACHKAYDASPMSWCMLPTNDVLDMFITHERRNYLERKAIAELTGVSPPRQTLESDPSFSGASIAYQPYFFSEGFRRGISPSYYEQPELKRWEGDPTAAIHKALHGAFLPWPIKEVAIPTMRKTALLGLPEMTKYRLSELAILWSRPDPVGLPSPPQRAMDTPTGSGNDGGHGGNNVEPKDRPGGNDRKSGSAHHSSSAFDQKVSGSSSQNQEMDTEDRFSNSPSLTNASTASLSNIHIPPENGWLFGPQYSAADVLKFAGIKEGEE